VPQNIATPTCPVARSLTLVRREAYVAVHLRGEQGAVAVPHVIIEKGAVELEAALLDGFAETLNVEIQADPLSVLEERMADDLAVREYGDLTRMRAPVPDATRCGDGGADSVLAASVGWGLT